MINYFDIAVLLFLKDFKENGNDRYFIFDNNALTEVNLTEILELKKLSCAMTIGSLLPQFIKL